MEEGQSGGVKTEAAEGVLAGAIGAVAEDRVAERGELGADLSPTAGDEGELQERRRVAALEHMVVGNRLTAGGGTASRAHAQRPVFVKPRSKPALSLAHRTLDEGQIAPLDASCLELTL